MPSFYHIGAQTSVVLGRTVNTCREVASVTSAWMQRFTLDGEKFEMERETIKIPQELCVYVLLVHINKS